MSSGPFEEEAISAEGKQTIWEDDSRNPNNWSQLKKWSWACVACLITFVVGLNSTAITTAFPEIGSEFSINDEAFENSFFTVTAWNLAAAVVPMATLPLMDTFGTRVTYMLCYAIFVIFIIPQALAHNFATLVVSRAIAGAAGGTLQNACEGVIANLWQTSSDRLFAISLYVFSLSFGVTMGPVQGAVVGVLNWRWILWIQLIIYGIIAPLVLLMPETRGDVIRQRTRKHEESKESGGALQEIRTTVTRSAKLLTTDPTIFSFTLWSAFSFGLIFMSTESAALVFEEAFHFKGYQTGLVQAAIGIGEAIGLGVCVISNRHYYNSRKAKYDDTEPVVKESEEGIGKSIPEYALHFSIPATLFFLSGGLFVYGWTSYQTPALPWIAPAIGLAMQGFGIQVIITAASVYITDSYELFAASAIAAIAFGENVFAAFLPLASLPMYTNLGFEWASTLLGVLAFCLAGAPIVLTLKGKQIRSRSKAIQEMSRE